MLLRAGLERRIQSQDDQKLSKRHSKRTYRHIINFWWLQYENVFEIKTTGDSEFIYGCLSQ